jgi:integrase/recombinase XerD
MTQTLELFKNHLLASGLQQSTVNYYLSCTRKFIEQMSITSISDITKAKINEFFVSLLKIYSKGTINNFNKALRAFIEFTGLEIIMPKEHVMEKKIYRVITKEELDNMIDPMLDLLFENHVKIRAILYFMFYSGLRVSEVASLKRKNFNFITHEVIVTDTKSKKEKLVFMNEIMEKHLQYYFSYEPEITTAFNYSKQSIQNIFQILMKQQVIPGVRLYAHLFRHSNITYQLNCGLSTSYVKDIIGHADIRTTEGYTHLDKEDLKKAFREKVK